MVLLRSIDSKVDLAWCSFTIFVFLRRVQVLLIHRLTPTHEAAETMLQELWLALCHLLKDHLIVVASVFLAIGSYGLPTLPAGRPVPMLRTFLQPELLPRLVD